MTDPAHDLTKRVEVASRIAAVTLLSNRFAIDARHETSEGSVLSLRDLLHDGEGQKIENLLHDTLRTGLFVGSERRKWVHQSFAEYLAARYLSQDSLRVKDIVGITTAQDRQFAPQLYEVLRWLIEMRPDVLKRVVKTQPALLLTSDLSHLEEEDLRSVYDAMLNLDDVHLYVQPMWSLKRFHASHPAAKRILLPYLRDNHEAQVPAAVCITTSRVSRFSGHGL